MKALIFGFVGAVAFAGSANSCSAATQAQATVSGVLDELKFEFVPPKDGTVGGPQEYVVTKETIPFLRRKTFWLKGDGSITFKKPDGAGGAQATQEQALVSGALESLKFEYMKPKDGRIGGDQEFQVTMGTIQHLRQSRKFWLLSDGSISFKKP